MARQSADRETQARATRDGLAYGRTPERREAEELADALPPLLVEAERIAATVAPGIHGRKRTGPGETFWQYRRYEQGGMFTKSVMNCRSEWFTSVRPAVPIPMQ